MNSLSDIHNRSLVQKAWEHIFTQRGKPADLKALESMFPERGTFDVWDLSHIHKVVLGTLPVDLESELKNEQNRSLVNASDFRGRTPLHWAASRGDVSTVKILLQAGAKADAEDEMHGTPLSFAASSGSIQALKSLIAAGANIQAKNRRGTQALYFACRHQSDIAPIKLLLRAGAQINCKNINIHTPLTGAAITNRREIGAFLLDQGADMDNRGIYGDTPLSEAVIHNSHEFLEMLLQSGTNYMGVNDAGSTILHAAAREADEATVNLLAAAELRGLDSKARDKK